MPTIAVNGTRLYYEDTGGDGEPIVFSHGLLWDARMFEAQVEELSRDHRVIAYDHRGQGRSAVPTESVIPMDLLYADAVALIEALGAGPCHLAGLSMGGFVAMRVAARRPDLVRSLILLETSAGPEPSENVPRYRLLSLITGLLGPGVVADRVMPIMFGETFLGDPARRDERERWKTILSGNRRDITKAVRGVIERNGIEDEIRGIGAPTLVIVGEEDVATTPDKAEAIVDAVPDATLVRIPGAGHSSTIEQPDLVTDAIRSFLTTR